MYDNILSVNAFSAESLITCGGVFIIVAAVYIETGLLLGLIVPGGETLLFTAGLFTATDYFNFHVSTLIALCIIAAIAGDNTGYFIGKNTGPRIYHWKE